LLIEDYVFTHEEKELQTGDIFESVEFKAQLELIKERHYHRYSDQALHEVFD
jgi:hypothetical protein